MTSKSRNTMALMFADIKSYSQIDNDRLYDQLSDIFKQEILARITNADVTLLKTAGDSAILHSATTVPLAKAALRLRDDFRTYDWIAVGFPYNLEIRIGLHLDEVTVEYGSDKQVDDVIGKGMIKGARIEPVTPPNSVYCSEHFYNQLMAGNPSNLKGISRGRMPLAKDYGEMPVCELVWRHENLEVANEASKSDDSPTTVSIPMPTIGGKFTDKQKTDFLYDALPQIRIYFEKAKTQLMDEEPRIEVTIRVISETKFICELYIDGNSKSRCKVWIGTFGTKLEYICFATGNFRMDDDGSTNDIVSVEVENNRLRLKSQMGMASFVKDFDVKTASTPEQIAEYFWRRLTDHL